MGISRVGAQLGTAREARTAHAIVATAKPHKQALQNMATTAWDVWWDGGQQGTEPSSVADYHDLYQAYLPHGWQYLGEGCYRTVLLSPSGVVYKVNSDLEDGYNGNTQELRSIKRVYSRGIPTGWAVPDATLYPIPNTYDAVIAMPLVDTSMPLADCYDDDCHCNTSKGNRAVSHRKGSICTNDIFNTGQHFFWDLHNGNVFPDSTGVLWVIDVCTP